MSVVALKRIAAQVHVGVRVLSATRLSARGPGTGTASFGFGRSQRSATWSNVASKHEDQGSKSCLSAGLELCIAACQIGSEIQCLDHVGVDCIASCDPQCRYHDHDGCWRTMDWPYAIWDGPSPEELLEEWRPAFMPICDSVSDMGTQRMMRFV